MSEPKGYRKNVAIILFRNNEFLLVNKKQWPNDFWKLPQGGLDGEEVKIAAKRELKEEVGTDNIEIIGISKFENKYHWDPKRDAETIKRTGKIGQEQNFVIAKFLGTDDEIKPDDEEVETAKWISKEELIEYSDMKKPLFEAYHGVIPKILEEFGL